MTFTSRVICGALLILCVSVDVWGMVNYARSPHQPHLYMQPQHLTSPAHQQYQPPQTQQFVQKPQQGYQPQPKQGYPPQQQSPQQQTQGYPPQQQSPQQQTQGYPPQQQSPSQQAQGYQQQQRQGYPPQQQTSSQQQYAPRQPQGYQPRQQYGPHPQQGYPPQQQYGPQQQGQGYSQQYGQQHGYAPPQQYVKPKKTITNYVTPCQYLSSRKSRRPENACPFEIEIYTRGERNIERGKAIRITIKPWENSPYIHEYYTDFIAYAVPDQTNAEAPVTVYRPLGVWDLTLYPHLTANAKGLKCNRGSVGHDAVGSFEEFIADLHQARGPPIMRKTWGIYFWYPTESAMTSQAIIFVVKMKKGGEWCKLSSPPLPVYNPPSPQVVQERQLNQLMRMRQHMQEMERRANLAEAQAGAPP